MKQTVAWMGLLALLAAGCATNIGPRAQETEALKSQVASLEGKIGDLNQKVEEVSQRQGALETEVQATRSTRLLESSQPKPSAPAKATGSYSKVASLSDRQIQQALKTAGFYAGPIDGRIGPQTKEAVRKFQRSNRLSPDGQVGTRTSSALAKFLEPASRIEPASRLESGNE